ncbi:LPXTG cell wall anchor domain-containing protein [Candidatus Arthromitus sp. SFB-rat-Yit]|uniref:LPXTG cell wall anchor domain-containing protein n=1 Tax=Candidatus Arthromitus sp. SFB-rat-Yit TaxID=1041504 RepID=UPI0002E4D255|nr:LPXTG cell wall anchor domain-containing protein [Candidatus Arthromitus sp. SFB-rat-Yit]
MKKDEKSAWILFLISIGLLFIMLSPRNSNPMIMIIGGLLIILLGVILFKKNKSGGKKR